MRINSQNIIAYIQYLYKNKYGVDASEEIIESWKKLSDQEINNHLQTMYQKWQKTQIDLHLDIEKFIQLQENPQKLSEKINQQQPIPHIDRNNTHTAPITNITTSDPDSVKEHGHKKGIVIFSTTLFLIISAYVFWQFSQYKSLETLYVITDNVTVRNKEGAIVGRMDISNEPNSYQSLKATNTTVYEIPVDNKVSPSRQLLLPDAGFWDFLFKKNDKIVYVNSNFLTNNEAYNNMNTQVFKEINNVKTESTALKSVYKKVIVGSMMLDPNLKNNYVENTCNNSTKEYTSIIKLALKDKKQYTVIARLNDGYYYKFTGNPDENSFTPPSRLKIVHPTEEGFIETNTQFLFKEVSGRYYLYTCDLSNTDFVAIKDNNGDIIQFQSAFSPTN